MVISIKLPTWKLTTSGIRIFGEQAWRCEIHLYLERELDSKTWSYVFVCVVCMECAKNTLALWTDSLFSNTVQLGGKTVLKLTCLHLHSYWMLIPPSWCPFSYKPNDWSYCSTCCAIESTGLRLYTSQEGMSLSIGVSSREALRNFMLFRCKQNLGLYAGRFFITRFEGYDSVAITGINLVMSAL